jgi:hypothetical protein
VRLPSIHRQEQDNCALILRFSLTPPHIAHTLTKLCVCVCVCVCVCCPNTFLTRLTHSSHSLSLTDSPCAVGRSITYAQPPLCTPASTCIVSTSHATVGVPVRPTRPTITHFTPSLMCPLALGVSILQAQGRRVAKDVAVDVPHPAFIADVLTKAGLTMEFEVSCGSPQHTSHTHTRTRPLLCLPISPVTCTHRGTRIASDCVCYSETIRRSRTV